MHHDARFRSWEPEEPSSPGSPMVVHRHYHHHYHHHYAVSELDDLGHIVGEESGTSILFQCFDESCIDHAAPNASEFDCRAEIEHHHRHHHVKEAEMGVRARQLLEDALEEGAGTREGRAEESTPEARSLRWPRTRSSLATPDLSAPGSAREPPARSRRSERALGVGAERRAGSEEVASKGRVTALAASLAFPAQALDDMPQNIVDIVDAGRTGLQVPRTQRAAPNDFRPNRMIKGNTRTFRVLQRTCHKLRGCHRAVIKEAFIEETPEESEQKALEKDTNEQRTLEHWRAKSLDS
eukprot:g13463.t1